MNKIDLKKFENKTFYGVAFHCNLDNEVNSIIFKDIKRRQQWWGWVLKNNDKYMIGESPVYYVYEFFEVSMPCRLVETMRFDFGKNV